MMRKSQIGGFLRLALTILFYLPVLLLPLEAEATKKIVAIEGIGYNVNASMKDNLKSLIGKKVSIALDSGNTFTGFVKEVGSHSIHLEKLDGKGYFDALIRIDDISAIDTRFRSRER